MDATAPAAPVPVFKTEGLTSTLDAVMSNRLTLATFTRAVIAIKLSPGTGVADLDQLLSSCVQPNTAVSGLAIVCGTKAVLVTEQTPEATVFMMRRLGKKAEASSTLVSARVVAAVEDCPSHFFGALTVHSFSGATDPPGAPPADAPLKAALTLYKQILALAVKLAADTVAMAGAREGEPISASLLDSLDRYVSILPAMTETRLEGLATSSSALPSCGEYVTLYSSAVDGTPASEEVLPLPARVPY